MPVSQSSAPRAYPPCAPSARAGLGAQALEHSPPPTADAIGSREDRANRRSLWMNGRRAHRLFTVGAVNCVHAHGDHRIAAPPAAWERAADRLASALRHGCPSIAAPRRPETWVTASPRAD